MINIFVGALSRTVGENDLREIFENFGEVSSVRVVTDKYTGESKGFAFVEMPNEEEANKAISEINGTDLGGRQVAVSVARPREERSNDRGGYRDRNRGGGGNSGGYQNRGNRRY